MNRKNHIVISPYNIPSFPGEAFLEAFDVQKITSNFLRKNLKQFFNNHVQYVQKFPVYGTPRIYSVVYFLDLIV